MITFWVHKWSVRGANSLVFCVQCGRNWFVFYFVLRFSSWRWKFIFYYLILLKKIPVPSIYLIKRLTFPVHSIISFFCADRPRVKFLTIFFFMVFKSILFWNNCFICSCRVWNLLLKKKLSITCNKHKNLLTWLMKN